MNVKRASSACCEEDIPVANESCEFCGQRSGQEVE